MKAVIACAIALGLAAAAAAQSPDAIRLYVFTAPPDHGIVDEGSKARAAAAQNIAKFLKKNKEVQLVADREHAEVVVEVTRSERVVGAGNERPKMLVAGVVIGTGREDRWITQATLTFGDYSTTLEKHSSSDVSGLSDLAMAGAIKEWLKDNRQKVLEARGAK